CQQLREFLLLTREEQIDPLSLKGSYAGAMGMPQFMPGSFRAYAVDFDGDERIDICNNPVDAIGSDASYFKRHGWAAGAPVVSRVRGSGERVEEGTSPGVEAHLRGGDRRELGWQPELALDDELAVIAIRFEGEEGAEFWLGLSNFHVITRY